ncbi:zinc-binding dehydrogenase [Raoultella planticola]|uniref:zinc-binding dehydrogenase n=1 Tax=Raoultella planticola TaxID=575 RepID=UPI0015DEDBF3|nr:zinc-binding dehydrogenase [Raoultella planticola]
MATRIEFHQHGGPDVLKAVEFTPADPLENEIQVENKAIGINYIDTYIRSGLYPPPSLPSGLGTEAAGVVTKVGRSVQHIKAGDRVVYAQSALGAKLIGTVGSAQKAQRAKQAGAWQVINYREENIVERLKEITEGKKVHVVYDSVGKDTWEASLDCLQRRGLMVSFGNSSGPVTGVNLGILNQKGSLYVTRPSLQGYITNRQELAEASGELFSLIASGAINVDVAESQKYALTDARRAHEVLESRATEGSSLLLP